MGGISLKHSKVLICCHSYLEQVGLRDSTAIALKNELGFSAHLKTARILEKRKCFVKTMIKDLSYW